MIDFIRVVSAMVHIFLGSFSGGYWVWLWVKWSIDSGTTDCEILFQFVICFISDKYFEKLAEEVWFYGDYLHVYTFGLKVVQCEMGCVQCFFSLIFYFMLYILTSRKFSYYAALVLLWVLYHTDSLKQVLCVK